MKKYLVIITLIVFSAGLFAAGWELDSNLNFTLTQSLFSDNWHGDELSNINWVVNSNSTAEKQLKDWLHNKNTLKLAFGQSYNQKIRTVYADENDVVGKEEKHWGSPEKSTDKIDLESLFRFTTHGWVDPFVAGRFESQFLDRSQTDTRYVNPMLFTETAGIMRSFIDAKNTKLSTRLGAAFRENVNRGKLSVKTTTADDGTIEVKTEKETEVTLDGGLEMVTELMKKLNFPLNMDYRSRLQLYKALFNSKSKDLNDDWKALDVVWENILTTKLFGALSANFILEFRFDKEEDQDWQFKEILGLGLSYNFF